MLVSSFWDKLSKTTSKPFTSCPLVKTWTGVLLWPVVTISRSFKQINECSDVTYWPLPKITLHITFIIDSCEQNNWMLRSTLWQNRSTIPPKNKCHCPSHWGLQGDGNTDWGHEGFLTHQQIQIQGALVEARFKSDQARSMAISVRIKLTRKYSKMGPSQRRRMTSEYLNKNPTLSKLISFGIHPISQRWVSKGPGCHRSRHGV